MMKDRNELFDFDAVIDALGPLLGLTVTAEMRPGVKLHLEATARIAAPLLAFALDDEAEPAPVFTP